MEQVEKEEKFEATKREAYIISSVMATDMIARLTAGKIALKQSNKNGAFLFIVANDGEFQILINALTPYSSNMLSEYEKLREEDEAYEKQLEDVRNRQRTTIAGLEFQVTELHKQLEKLSTSKKKD